LAFSNILCPPPQHPNSAPCGITCLEGAGCRVYHVSFKRSNSINDDSINDDLAPASTPTVLLSVRLHGVGKQLDCTPFWLKPISVFGFFPLTMRAAVHVSWACHPV